MPNKNHSTDVCQKAINTTKDFNDFFAKIVKLTFQQTDASTSQGNTTGKDHDKCFQTTASGSRNQSRRQSTCGGRMLLENRVSSRYIKESQLYVTHRLAVIIHTASGRLTLGCTDGIDQLRPIIANTTKSSG